MRCLSSKVSTFLNYTYQGADFVFAYLATGKPFIPEAFNRTGEPDLTLTVQGVLRDINNMGVVPAPFFFGPLSIIYFVSFFVSMLYYWGTLQFIVKKIGEDQTFRIVFWSRQIRVKTLFDYNHVTTGWLLYVTVGTTAAESMNAAANIFLGQTEAPLLIRPFLSTMTK